MFAMQIGQSCAACQVGVFGSQLKPYGRDFKMNGFVLMAISGWMSLTCTDNADVRYANGDGALFDHDMIWGIDANNSPTVSDRP